jgi:hypothetical protein
MNTPFESDAPAGSEPGATETHVTASNEPIALPGVDRPEESVKGGEPSPEAADETPSGASGDEDFVPAEEDIANSTMLQAMVGERWKEAVWVDTHGKYVHTDGTYVHEGQYLLPVFSTPPRRRVHETGCTAGLCAGHEQDATPANEAQGLGTEASATAEHPDSADADSGSTQEGAAETDAGLPE